MEAMKPPKFIIFTLKWVFGHPFDPSRGFNEKEKYLSQDIMTWWTNFAKYG